MRKLSTPYWPSSSAVRFLDSLLQLIMGFSKAFSLCWILRHISLKASIRIATRQGCG